MSRASSTINPVNSEPTILPYFMLQCVHIVVRPLAGTVDTILEFELQFEDLVLLLQEDKSVEFREATKDEFSGGTHLAGLVQEFFVGVGNEGAFERGFIDLDFLLLLVRGCGASFQVS